ncbi:ABC transporter permease [Vibrio hippocampi]|uniref:ABC transporter permease n=1 Tax=Vibrio hippocampi TaxID=654686 RepID=UPI001F1B8235|nr:thiamine ABC transporter permease [Vibrio hippocampi]
MLRLLYALLVIVCIVPTVPGLAGVLLAAAGYLPQLGFDTASLDSLVQVLRWPGVEKSVALTVSTTFISSYLALIITFFILQSCWHSNAWRKIEWLLSPMLAFPHVAFAIGFAFLFSPTGLVARLWQSSLGQSSFGQSLLGQVPLGSESLLIHDAWGLGMIAMLVVKEVPFLLLMSIPILNQLNVSRSLIMAQSLGYSSYQAWWKVILPQWLVKIRFPLLAVVAYGVSVVDIALILGPTTPPTFSVLVWQWFNDPALSLLPQASAGAVLLFAIACLFIGLVKAIEWLVCQRLNQWHYSGRFALHASGRVLFSILATVVAVIIPITLIWSFAQRWRFPDMLPSRYTTRFWHYEWDNLISVVNQSLLIAIVSASLALLFAVIAHEFHHKHKYRLPNSVIAIPMLLPQLSLLFGLQVTTLLLSSNSFSFWVYWSHVFFAFPYVYLALDGPWSSYDHRLTQAALSLGKSPLQSWFKVKLPQLLPAVLFAWAIGISVSLAQYLPTLMLGAGRVATVTTEAVALSSGFDRRVTAIYALFQALLPLAFFLLVVVFNRCHMSRRKLKVKGTIGHAAYDRKPHHS